MTETLGDVTHTHSERPADLSGRLFVRGLDVRADGGERVGQRLDGRGEGRETMRDVDHTPPHHFDANRVWWRGGRPDEST